MDGRFGLENPPGPRGGPGSHGGRLSGALLNVALAFTMIGVFLDPCCKRAPGAAAD